MLCAPGASLGGMNTVSGKPHIEPVQTVAAKCRNHKTGPVGNGIGISDFKGNGKLQRINISCMFGQSGIQAFPPAAVIALAPKAKRAKRQPTIKKANLEKLLLGGEEFPARDAAENLDRTLERQTSCGKTPNKIMKTLQLSGEYIAKPHADKIIVIG